MKQAAEHINHISTSMQDANTTISNTQELLQSSLVRSRLTIPKCRRNGYDGGVCDRLRGPERLTAKRRCATPKARVVSFRYVFKLSIFCKGSLPISHVGIVGEVSMYINCDVEGYCHNLHCNLLGYSKGC